MPTTDKDLLHKMGQKEYQISHIMIKDGIMIKFTKQNHDCKINYSPFKQNRGDLTPQ